MIGALDYVPLEQILGEEDINHRTDMWAIGVMLYVILAGERPWDAHNTG